VFPSPNHEPTSLGESLAVPPVACAISLNLHTPIIRICDWLLAMDWAPMPEAAVDENSASLPWEDDVCRASNAGHWLLVLSEPKAASVEGASNQELRLGVL
jgi:hypothetical protein